MRLCSGCLRVRVFVFFALCRLIVRVCVCAPLVLDILLTRLLAALLVVVFARLHVVCVMCACHRRRCAAEPRGTRGGGPPDGPTGAEPARGEWPGAQRRRQECVAHTNNYTSMHPRNKTRTPQAQPHIQTRTDTLTNERTNERTKHNTPNTTTRNHTHTQTVKQTVKRAHETHQ